MKSPYVRIHRRRPGPEPAECTDAGPALRKWRGVRQPRTRSALTTHLCQIRLAERGLPEALGD